MSESTLHRWLREEEFIAEYRAAKRKVLEEGIRQVQAAYTKAVEATVRNLSCGQVAYEIRAAQLIMEQSLRGMELLDIEVRIMALEAPEDKE